MKRLSSDHTHKIVERMRHYAARCGFDLDGEDVFDKFDTNHDGTITKHEFIDAMKDELLCRVYYDRANPRINTLNGTSFILKRDLFCVLDRDHVARKFLDERSPGIWFNLQSAIMKDANATLGLVDFLNLISYSTWQAKKTEEELVEDAEAKIMEAEAPVATEDVVDAWLTALPSTTPPMAAEEDEASRRASVKACLISLSAALPTPETKTAAAVADAKDAALPPTPPVDAIKEATPQGAATQLAYGAISIEEFHTATASASPVEKRALLVEAHQSYTCSSSSKVVEMKSTVVTVKSAEAPRAVMGGTRGLPPKYLSDKSIEAPAGESTDGSAVFAIYTSEQQERLSVNEAGAPVDNAKWATWATQGQKAAIMSAVDEHFASKEGASTTRAELAIAMRSHETVAPLLGLKVRGDGSEVEDLFSSVSVNKALEIMKRSGGSESEELTKEEAASFLAFDDASRIKIASATAEHSAKVEVHTAAIEAIEESAAPLEAEALLDGFSFVDNSPLAASKVRAPMVLSRAQKKRMKTLFETIDADHDTLISIAELEQFIPDEEAEFIMTHFDLDDISGACAAVDMNFIAKHEFVIMMNSLASNLSDASEREALLVAWEDRITAHFDRYGAFAQMHKHLVTLAAETFDLLDVSNDGIVQLNGDHPAWTSYDYKWLLSVCAGGNNSVTKKQWLHYIYNLVTTNESDLVDASSDIVEHLDTIIMHLRSTARPAEKLIAADRAAAILSVQAESKPGVAASDHTQLNVLFASLDQDGDGRVDVNEFLSALKVRQRQASAVKHTHTRTHTHTHTHARTPPLSPLVGTVLTPPSLSSLPPSPSRKTRRCTMCLSNHSLRPARGGGRWGCGSTCA